MQGIRAAITSGPHASMVVEKVTLRDPGSTEVVVRVEATGICHSDLNPLEGRTKIARWPVVLGHEATGIIESVGSAVRDLKPGNRILVSGLRSCGRCWWCVRGETNLCSTSTIAMEPPMVRGDGTPVAGWMGLGTFADAMVIAQDAAIKIESDLPPEQLALVGCGVTTGIGAVVNTAKVRPGDTVAVIGLGGVGQSVVQGARLSGASCIIAVDPVAMKRVSATALGATDTIDPESADVVEAIRELTAGRGVDHAFEVVGRSETTQQAYDAVRPGGALTLVGAASPEITAPWSLYDMMRNEKRVLGSLLGSANIRRDFPLVVSMVEAGLLHLDSMVSKRLALEDINEGIAALVGGEVIRAVVVNFQGPHRPQPLRRKEGNASTEPIVPVTPHM